MIRKHRRKFSFFLLMHTIFINLSVVERKKETLAAHYRCGRWGLDKAAFRSMGCCLKRSVIVTLCGPEFLLFMPLQMSSRRTKPLAALYPSITLSAILQGVIQRNHGERMMADRNRIGMPYEFTPPSCPLSSTFMSVFLTHVLCFVSGPRYSVVALTNTML